MLLAIGEKMRGGVIAMSFVIIIAVLMIVPLLYDYVAGAGSNDVITVDDKKISSQAFQQEMNMSQLRLQQAFGGKIPDYINQSDFLTKQTVDGIIQEALLDHETLDNGYNIGDAQLVKMIRELPQFQENGEYSAETAKRQLESMGYSQGQFKQLFKRQLVQAQLQDGINSSAFLPQKVVEQVAALQFQKRSFSYLMVEAEKLRQQQKVSKDEMTAYFESNKAAFQHPEKASVHVVSFGFDDFKKNLSVNDAEVTSEYEAGTQAGRYSTPESRKVSHILIESKDENAEKKAKAESILKELNEGKIAFEAAAKQHSQDPGSASEGGSLGDIQRGMMVPEFDKAAFEQEKGVIGPVIKSDFGYHIVKVDDITEKKIKPLKDVKQDIIESIKNSRARGLFDEHKEEIKNIAYEQPDSLDPVVNYLNAIAALKGAKFNKQSTELFTREKGTGLAENAAIRAAAFNDSVLLDKNTSEAIDLGDNRIAYVHVKEHEVARDMSFDEAKSKIETALLDQKTKQAVQALSSELFAEAKEGKSLKALAKKHKLTVKQAKDLTRANAGEAKDVNVEIIRAAFALPTLKDGKPQLGETSYGIDNKAVIELSKVENAQWSSLSESEQTELKSRLVASIGSGDVQSMLNALRDKADIWISPELKKAQGE